MYSVLFTFSVFVLSLALSTRVFFLYYLNPQNLFFLSLLGINFQFPLWFYYLSSVVIFILLFWISYKIFPKKYNFYPNLVLSLSPWIWYLTTSESIYVYLTFLILVGMVGILLIRGDKLKLGSIIFLVSIFLLIYSSLSLSLTIPFILVGLWITKSINPKLLLKLSLLIILFYLPVLFLIKSHPEAFKNIYQNQIKFLDNPGILAEANRLQGDSKKMGYQTIPRLVENKYLYTTKFLLSKELVHLSPSTYFTPFQKIFSFSYTTPILLGFLIPFLIGLLKLINNPKLRRFLIFIPILTIPSLLSEKTVDLNRLIILLPIIVLIIGWGLIKTRENKFFWRLTLLIVGVQLIFTVLDIETLETARFHKHFGDPIQLEVGRQ